MESVVKAGYSILGNIDRTAGNFQPVFRLPAPGNARVAVILLAEGRNSKTRNRGLMDPVVGNTEPPEWWRQLRAAAASGITVFLASFL